MLKIYIFPLFYAYVSFRDMMGYETSQFSKTSTPAWRVLKEIEDAKATDGHGLAIQASIGEDE